MKKVLIIITSGLGRGGISVSQLDYIKEIKEKCDDFKFELISCRENLNQMISLFESEDCIVYKLPDRKKKTIKYMVQLNKIMKKNKYDIIHVHGNCNSMAIELFLAKKNGIRKRIVHSRNTETNSGFLNFVLKPLFFKCYNVALAVGKEAGDWLFKDKKYNILHNGKKYDKYKFNMRARNIIRKKYGICDKIALCNVGNYTNQKNQKYLLDIFYSLENEKEKYVLFIVGDGPNKDELYDYAEKLKIQKNVVFTGHMDDIQYFINGMDLMLLPSLYEGLPNVVLEWQINGLDSLVSNNITKECKFTNQVKYLGIDKSNISEWKKEILNYKINIENRKILSEESESKLKKAGFDLDENANKLINIYNK